MLGNSERALGFSDKDSLLLTVDCDIKLKHEIIPLNRNMNLSLCCLSSATFFNLNWHDQIKTVLSNTLFFSLMMLSDGGNSQFISTDSRFFKIQLMSDTLHLCHSVEINESI